MNFAILRKKWRGQVIDKLEVSCLCSLPFLRVRQKTGPRFGSQCHLLKSMSEGWNLVIEAARFLRLSLKSAAIMLRPGQGQSEQTPYFLPVVAAEVYDHERRSAG
jgi:hypothetical protein